MNFAEEFARRVRTVMEIGHLDPDKPTDIRVAVRAVLAARPEFRSFAMPAPAKVLAGAVHRVRPYRWNTSELVAELRTKVAPLFPDLDREAWTIQGKNANLSYPDALRHLIGLRINDLADARASEKGIDKVTAQHEVMHAPEHRPLVELYAML